MRDFQDQDMIKRGKNVNNYLKHQIIRKKKTTKHNSKTSLIWDRRGYYVYRQVEGEREGPEYT